MASCYSTMAEMLSVVRLGTNLFKGTKENNNILHCIVDQVGKELENKYLYKIEHVDRLYIVELYNHLLEIEKENNGLITDESHMIPDGGALMITSFNGLRFPLVIAELKQQGTGKKKTNGKYQQSGNAIERTGKNIIFMAKWMRSLAILPFVVFVRGKDFRSGSSIIDRLKILNFCFSLNNIHYYKDKYNQGGGSIFYNDELGIFSEEEINKMYEIIYSISENALLYYIDKGMVVKNV